MSPVPVKTIEEIRQRSAAILRQPDYEAIEWVGLFGSFCRSTQTAESDVDLVVGYRAGTPMRDVCTVASGMGDELEDALGREVELLHMARQDVGSYLLLEALLTSVTIYGSQEWPHSSREQARHYLDEGYLRLKKAYQLLKEVRDLVGGTTEVSLRETQLTWKVMMTPDTRVLSLFQQIASSLDFAKTHPFYNGLFTPVIWWVIEEKELLQRVETGIINIEDWERVWKIVTKDFFEYQKGIGAAYLKLVEQTCKYADIE
jgi:predicted nucleotidyltransferase